MTKNYNSWLHYWAVLTVSCTFVLLTLGAIVTTFQVGMADPIWPTYPWHLLLVSWQEPSPGFLIEHCHRLAGYIVGCCVIVLTISLWLQERRRWLQWLGTVALLAVILQGLLGGFRVLLNRWLGSDLALVHGCFASLVFTLLVSLALFTSSSWVIVPPNASAFGSDSGLKRAGLFTTCFIFLQIVFGALLRHTYSPLGPRGHLLVAFAVVAGTVWIFKEVRDQSISERPLSMAGFVLVALVIGQLVLGVEAWMLKYFASSSPAQQAIVRTLHVLLGFAILATSVTLTLFAHRRVNVSAEEKVAPTAHWEGVA